MNICHLAITHNVIADSRIMEKMACHSAMLGDKVSIISCGLDSTNYKNVNLISVSRTKPTRIMMPFIAVRCMYKALSLKADVYHIHEVPLMFLGIILVLFRRKVVLDFHEDFEADILNKKYLNKTFKNIFYYIFLVFKRLVMPMFDHIILAEDSYEEKFKKFKSKVTIIRNYPIANLIRFQEHLNSNELKIVYLGAISEERGCLNLVDAVIQIINEKKINISLELIGPIHNEIFKNTLVSKIKNFRDSIKWTGPLPYSDAVKKLTEYDVGFSALHDIKNYRNSLPTKVLEYNLAGLICVISDLPISHKYVKNEENGIIIKPNSTIEVKNAFEKIWKENLYLNRLKLHNYVKDNYSWESEFLSLNNIYKSL